MSTGKAEQLALQRRLYDAPDHASVKRAFDAAIDRLPDARAFLLAVPSDVGAGFRRGANLGPQAIREALLQAVPSFPELARESGLVDLGDVFVVPQLLHDSMLSEAQLQRSRRALYPDLSAEARDLLPVSPLSIAERALDLVFSLKRDLCPVLLGGDHSTAWPVVSALSRARTDRWAIVQSDAHTDLLEERLGVQYCFATWSWHANELFQRDGRLVQVGIRASGRDKAHWEGTLGVRQLWADECMSDQGAAIDAIVAHLRSADATSVYFSNDIDGTDSRWASATGTPEPRGLSPEFLVALMRRMAEEFSVIGGDVMEVAPPLGESPEATTTTIQLAVRYLRETLTAILDTPL